MTTLSQTTLWYLSPHPWVHALSVDRDWEMSVSAGTTRIVAMAMNEAGLAGPNDGTASFDMEMRDPNNINQHLQVLIVTLPNTNDEKIQVDKVLFRSNGTTWSVSRNPSAATIASGTARTKSVLRRKPIVKLMTAGVRPRIWKHFSLRFHPTVLQRHEELLLSVHQPPVRSYSRFLHGMPIRLPRLSGMSATQHHFSDSRGSSCSLYDPWLIHVENGMDSAQDSVFFIS